jgi:hypothetical protein
MLDLKPIQDRLSAVTPGAWHPVEFPSAKYVGVTAEHWDGCDMGYHVCSTEDCDPEDALPNAVFIAHAKADVAALVAEVERLRAAIALHRDRWRSGVGSGAWVHRKLWETLDAD